MKRISFHRKTLDALPLPRVGVREEYQDADAPELILRVSSTGQKTFALRRKIDGKAVRVTLGTYMRAGATEPDMTVAQARKAAGKAKTAAADGKNPNDIKQARRVEGLTLRAALKAYVEDSNRLKESTAAGYAAILQEVVPDWMDRPLRETTEEQVLARLKRHGQRSKARANAAMRVVRLLWNYARTFNVKNAPPVYGDNPVSILSSRNAWFRVERRRTRIKDDKLPAWWSGVTALRDSKLPAAADAADLFTLMLFTGLRPIEACALEWRYVDLHEKTIEIPDPKNREAHSLPLPAVLVDLFKARHKEKASTFVFPSTSDPKLPFKKPTLHKFVRVLKDETGVEFTPYDLRRGFATVAESMDISALAVKRLLNHRIAEADVTAGYVGRDPRRLADAMERIATKITEIATATTDNVVELKIPAKVG